MNEQVKGTEKKRVKFRVRTLDDIKKILIRLLDETYNGLVSTPVSGQCQRLLSTLIELDKQSELEERIKKLEKELKKSA